MLSVVLAVIIFVLLMVANKWLFTKRGGIPFGRWLEAAIIGGVVGIVNYASPMIHGSPWAVILFLGMLAVYVWLCFSWKQEGSEAKEVIPYIIVALLMYLTCESAAWATALLVTDATLRSFITTLPLIAMIGSIGYMIYNLLNFHYERCHRQEDTKKAERFKTAKTIVAIIVILLIVLSLFSGVSWNFSATPADEQEQEQVEEQLDEPEVGLSWYRFYHYDLVNDNNLEDDFDFGPSAYSTSTTAMVAKEEHFKRIEEDPALGCATFANFDVRLGTDFMIPGEHYDQYWSDGYWTTLINKRVQYYMANPGDYDIAVERWEAFVNKYARVTLDYQGALTDQMYMVSLTSLSELEAPEVIVMETTQPYGHVLNYWFSIKGNSVIVPFRTECGFQPTNVAEVMREIPRSNPNKKSSTSSSSSSKGSSSSSSSSSSSGSSSSSSGSGSSSGTVSGSGSNTRTTKDKTQGVQGDLVKPNDNPGPGPDTNNGFGAWYSTEDQVENSNHMSSYSEYEDTVDKLEEINQNQRRGGDSNTPTTKPADTTNDKTTVDNNADRGTGNGGIDSATPVSKPATEAETNKAINDSPGEAWGGPPD
ncbi:hypothetical protein IKF26_02855 [Candidatus Saccharibacteria bacterium]|nr:hypothetical protein [Candidatus Saccharibacteria bacterium]